MPSATCWIPNKSGIIAKGISAFRFVLINVVPPTADNEAPAMKLADAEKHIRLDSFLVDPGRGGACTSLPTPKLALMLRFPELHNSRLGVRRISITLHPITKATVTSNAPLSKYGAFICQTKSAPPKSGPPA